MIYLFNSAFRPKYVRNVLNTLYLPEHCANEYRYKFTGEKPYVSAGFFSGLENLKPGTECVVIFIDRYAEGGYAYHPLRRARFLQHRVVADYVYFKVELLDFIYPQNVEQFQERLVAQVAGMPRLTNGEPEHQHDGYYATESESVFGHANDFKTDDDAWTNAVSALSQTRAMRTNDEQWPIFLKLAIHRRKDGTSLPPMAQSQTPLFQLTKDEVFELVLTYRFPQQGKNNTSQCRLDIRLGENIRALGTSSFMVDSASNSAIVSFTTRRYAEDNRGNIGLEAPNQNKPQILVPDAHVEYLLEEGASFWFQIILGLALYAITGALIGVDFSRLSPFSWSALANAAWPRVVLAAVQAVGLFWLFKRIGKKVL